MDNIIYYAIQLVIAVVMFLVGKYVFPTVKNYFNELNTESVSGIATWVYKFVVSAKNQFDTKYTGEQKREYVTKQVKTLCEKYNIELTDEQIRALIEDAYVLMKENFKATFETDNTNNAETKVTKETEAVEK